MTLRPGTAHGGSGKKGGLSPRISRFYAGVYSAAKNGSIAELCRYGWSSEDAEEFFSTGFLRVMDSVDPVAREFSKPQMVSYIKRAAWHAMIDEYRRHGVRLRCNLDALSFLIEGETECPAQVAEEREAVAFGREAMQMLCERDRLIFRQRNEFDLGPEEILRRSPGLSMRTYRKLIERANRRASEAFISIESGQRCSEMESTLLRRHAAGGCSDREVRSVDAHLAHCRPCRAAYARLRIDRGQGGHEASSPRRGRGRGDRVAPLSSPTAMASQA